MSLHLNKSSWNHVALGDVASASKEKVDPTDGTVYRYIAGEHMDSNDLKLNRWGDVGDMDLGPAFHRRFRPGQVLYGSRRTYLRKVAVADFDGVCANTTFVLEPRSLNALLPEFLPFIMSSEPFHAFAIAESKGSVNPYVNWSDIARYEFLLPGLGEQRHIADLLWAVERHRLSLADKCRGIESGLQRLLGTHFSRAEGSSIRIVDLCSHVVGGVWGSPEGEDEVDVLALGPRVYSAHPTDLVTDGSPVRSVSKKQAETRIIREHDIILERSGGSPDQPVGRVVIAGPDLPASIPTDFQRLLRPDLAQVEPRYLFWKLRHDWAVGETRSYSRRTTNITNLFVPDYIAREMVLPDRAIQLDLLASVGVIEESLATTSVERLALEALRSSLLVEVFGGD